MKRLTKRLLSLILCMSILFSALPTQTLAYMVEGEKKPITITDANGKTTTADDSWEKSFPYGAFAFETSGLALKEGEDGIIKVYRLGGTAGRATAYLSYEPVVVENEEGKVAYDYAVSADDVDILVEEPQPVAQYQKVGKPAAPQSGKAAVTAQADEQGYILKLDAAADTYQWQALGGGVWTDVMDAVGPELPADAELVEGEYDYRCLYTQGGTEYVSVSHKGEVFTAPEEESVPPMPEGIELNARPVYTPLDLRGEGEKPYSGWAFELIFAEGEWVKEIHINALLDALPEAEEAATFTIRGCEGGEVLEAASTLLLRISDINEPEPSTLGFVVSEMTVDKADGTAEIMLERVGGNQRPVSIEYATYNGTAMAGKDYAAKTGKLMFYGGVNKLPVTVELIDDGVVNEEPVYFEIKLSQLLGDDGCTLGEGTVRVSVINSGKGELPNLATQLYDPEAVDLTDSVGTADSSANNGGGTVTGVQAAVETPESAPATLVPMGQGGEVSTQSYDLGDEALIQFNNPDRAWGKTLDLARWEYWRYLFNPPNLTDLIGGGPGIQSGKLGSGRTINIDRGVALQSRNEIEAGFSDAAISAMGAGEDTAGQLFSQYRAEIYTDNAHDTSWGLKYYSYTTPRFYLQQSGQSLVANPLRVKRFGSSAFDAYWKIKSSDVNSEDEKYYSLPFEGTYSGGLEFKGLNAKMSLLYHLENGNTQHERDELNDYSMVWLKKLELTRRNFAKDAFSVDISTPNDSDNVSGGVVRLSEADYDNLMPQVEIVGGAGGVDEAGKLFVGSTIRISAPKTPKGYSMQDVVVFCSSDGTNWRQFDKFDVDCSSNNNSATLKLMGSAGNPLNADDLGMRYKFRVVYSRKSTVTVDLAPSVPRMEGSPASIDTNKINQLFTKYGGGSDHDFISNGSGGGRSIIYGYSKFDEDKGDYVYSQDTWGIKGKPGSAADLSGNPATTFSFEAENIQWISLGLSYKDLVLVNGETYPGNAKIYLTKADMVGGMSVRYYHENYQTALSPMKTDISWMALYWDANGNGVIDGAYNEESGTFELDTTKDQFVSYIDPGAFNETLFAPRKNSEGKYCQYFIKACYTMTPRSLVVPRDADEKERAQILPAFLSALNAESAAYSQQTAEQKSYRYIVSGKTVQSGNGPAVRSSDNHLKYGSDAGKKSTLDIPLGGDFSPATLQNGAAAYTWNPQFRGNMLYPFAAPQPIVIQNSIAGETAVTRDYTLQRDSDGALTGYAYGTEGLERMNGYLSSFTGSTTFALVTQEQNYTTEEILKKMRPGVTLGGGSNVADGGIYVQSDGPSYFVTPDSVTMGGISTTPDAEYLKQMKDSGEAPETGIDMDDSGSSMTEFNQDFGVNLGSMEIAATDYVTILMDGNKVGFSIGIPLGKVGDEKQGFLDANGADNWTKFNDFFKKSNFGDENYNKAKTQYDKNHPSPAPSASARPTPSSPANPSPSTGPAPSASPAPSGTPEASKNSEFKSKSFDVSFSVTLAFLFEYNPLDNGYYFEGMTVSAGAALSFRLTGRLTVCPIVYIYLQIDASIDITTGLGVIRKAVEEESKILNAKTAATQNDAVDLTYITRPGANGPVITQQQYEQKDEAGKKAYKPESVNGETYYYKASYENFAAARKDYLESGKYCLNAEQYNLLTAAEKENYEWTTEGAYNKAAYTSMDEATAAYEKVASYSFETNKKAFNIRFNGMISVDVLVKNNGNWTPAESSEGFVTGFLSSDGTGDTQVVLKQQDGMDLGKTVKVVLRPLDHNPKEAMDKTTITYIALIKDIRDDVYWKGIELSPAVALELGAGVGVELLKLEIYAKVGLEATFLLGVYNRNYDPNDNDPSNDYKYEPASVESFGFSVGLGLRVVLLFFTFELDMVSFHVDYANGDGWSYGWSFLNDTVTASEDSGTGIKIRLPQSAANRQRLYAPEDNLDSDLSTQAYDPTDPNVPFQLSGYGSSVDAAVLTAGMMPGGDYKLISAGNRDFVVYTISRDTPAEEDAPQLVMSELTRTGGTEGGKPVIKYGLANPSGAVSPLYIPLDVEQQETGDLDFDVWVEESVAAGATTYTVNAAWVSYASPSAGPAAAPAGDPYGGMTADNYKTITAPEASSPEYADYQQWYNYYDSLSSYNAGVQARLAANAKNVVVKYAGWTYTDTAGTISSDPAFSTPESLRGAGNYAFAAAGSGETVFFGSTYALDAGDVAYGKYEQYLVDSGSSTEPYADYLRGVKKSNLDVLGTQSALNLAYQNGSNWAVSTKELAAGQTLGNVEFTKLDDGAYYVAYTTRADGYEESSGSITEHVTEERLYLRKVTVGSGSVTWGEPYLLRMTRDYDKDNTKDGLYNSANTHIKAFESPYFSNLGFLTAQLDSTMLTGQEETFSTMAVQEHTFLLFEMNGATYILLDDSLKSIVGSGKGTIHPFFTGAVHQNKDGGTAESVSGKLEVTIGADADGNLYAVYVGSVPNTTNNAIYLSAYDADTNTWGDGVMLAMRNMNTHEASVRSGWSDRAVQAAYLGLSGKGNGLLTQDNIADLYGADYAPGILEQMNGADVGDLGDGKNLTFTNLQATRGGGNDLLVLTQGTLTELQVEEYTYKTAGKDEEKTTVTVVPKRTPDGAMDSSAGMYAVSYGKGQQGLGMGSIAFALADFSLGSCLSVHVSAVNTGDTAFRGSGNQPITATLRANGQDIAIWEIYENIRSGENIFLEGECAALMADLKEGDEFVLNLTEYTDTASGYNGTSVDLTLFTVEEDADLGVENLTATVKELPGNGAKTRLNVDFLATNRGGENATGAYVQFSYRSGEDGNGNPTYSVLDLTGHNLTVGAQEDLSTMSASSPDELKNGILRLHNSTDGDTLGYGFGRRVTGTLDVPAGAFLTGGDKHLELRVEIFSSTADIRSMEVGVLNARHDEYNTANNVKTVTVEPKTEYAAAGYIVIPMGSTTLIPMSATNTTGTKPALSAEEVDDVSDGKNIGILNFKQTESSAGKVTGVLSITPTSQGTGVIHIVDAKTKTVMPMAFIVTDSVDGIDIYNDNAMFTFLNGDGTPYDKEGTNQDWNFMATDSWGSGSANEVPLRKNLAQAKTGASFTFNTVAETIDLYFKGTVRLSSDNIPNFVGGEVTNATGGSSPTKIELAANPETAMRTLKVTAVGEVTLDRLVEHYADDVVPVPGYDGEAPIFVWSRSFPATGAIQSGGTGIPLTLYVIDNEAVGSLTVNGSTLTLGSPEVRVLDEAGAVWQYNMGTLTANGQYAISAVDAQGNTVSTELIVDWFNAVATGDPGTVKVPKYAADFYLDADKWTDTGIGANDIGKLNITFTEENGNEKAADNTHEVYYFTGSGFTKMSPKVENAAAFPLNQNGAYWTRTVNSDKTWSAAVLYMGKVDQVLPKVSVSAEGGRLRWSAYKEGSNAANITMVTINGFQVSTAPARNHSGVMNVSYGGEYKIWAVDEGKNSVESQCTVSLKLNLSSCTGTSSAAWNQARDNGAVTVNLSAASGARYDKVASKPQENTYIGSYEAALVPADYDLTGIQEDEELIWKSANTSEGFELRYTGVTAGDHLVVVRDAQDHGNMASLPVTVADKAIVASANTINATDGADGQALATVAGGDTEGFEFAIVPVKKLEEGATPTIEDFLALDTAESAEDDIVWLLADDVTVSWRAKTFDKLNAGNYLIAVRGLYGASEQDMSGLETARAALAAAERALEEGLNPPENTTPPTKEELEELKAAAEAARTAYEAAAKTVADKSAAGYVTDSGLWSGAHVVGAVVGQNPISNPGGGSTGGSSLVKLGGDENGSVVYTVKYPAVKLTNQDRGKLVTANQANGLVLENGGLSVYIPKGTLTADFDVNRLLIDPALGKDGMVVSYTDAKGKTVIVPWCLVSGGTVAYFVSGLGDYKLVAATVNFEDVAGLWGEDSIHFAAVRELFSGTGDGMFSPEMPMSRAMFVTVLWRIAGSPAAEGGQSFPDVTGDWYRDAVDWAVENGITQGYGGGLFGSDDPVSREQMCVFLGRFLTYLGMELGMETEAEAFTDKGAISDWAVESVKMLTDAGIIMGTDGNAFAPGKNASRMEVGALLTRFITKLVEKYCGK